MGSFGEIVSDLLSPKMDKNNAYSSIYAAFGASCLYGLYFIIMLLITIFLQGVQSWILLRIVDVILIFVLAYGIYKENRLAAVAMPIYFLITLITKITTFGIGPLEGVIKIVLLLVLIRGAIATFVIRNYAKKHVKTKTRN